MLIRKMMPTRKAMGQKPMVMRRRKSKSNKLLTHLHLLVMKMTLLFLQSRMRNSLLRRTSLFKMIRHL